MAGQSRFAALREIACSVEFQRRFMSTGSGRAEYALAASVLFLNLSGRSTRSSQNCMWMRRTDCARARLKETAASLTTRNYQEASAAGG
jgi:hypothetical protein